MISSSLKTVFLATLLAVGCLPTLRANQDEAYRQFLSGTPCTAEQQAKIRFAAEPLGKSLGSTAFSNFHYKIHNGTDRKIAGILIAVTFKNPDSGEVETLDVFSDFTLIPASCGFGDVRFYYPHLATLEPKIALKEVRLIDLK
jgi:hypothetical protein